jgi:hypothetical protein
LEELGVVNQHLVCRVRCAATVDLHEILTQ